MICPGVGKRKRSASLKAKLLVSHEFEDQRNMADFNIITSGIERDVLTLYGGTWSVDGPMMCFKWDLARFAAYNGCWTTAIDGDSVTWYSARGILHTDPTEHITLVTDNPNNL